VGIEASSYRCGLVHEAIDALEVLTGDGRILVCTPDNAHRDLFYGFRIPTARSATRCR
jgi:hypothetical protein